MYSAIATALIAPENARLTSSSDHPATKPATGPNASRAYTYFPPALGSAAAISASTSVLSAATTPPSTHTDRISHPLPRYSAIRPGVRRIPAPITIPDGDRQSVADPQYALFISLIGSFLS